MVVACNFPFSLSLLLRWNASVLFSSLLFGLMSCAYLFRRVLECFHLCGMYEMMLDDDDCHDGMGTLWCGVGGGERRRKDFFFITMRFRI